MIWMIVISLYLLAGVWSTSILFTNDDPDAKDFRDVWSRLGYIKKVGFYLLQILVNPIVVLYVYIRY